MYYPVSSQLIVQSSQFQETVALSPKTPSQRGSPGSPAFLVPQQGFSAHALHIDASSS